MGLIFHHQIHTRDIIGAGIQFLPIVLYCTNSIRSFPKIIRFNCVSKTAHKIFFKVIPGFLFIRKYKEPAGISSAEEDYFAFIEMTELINEVAEKDAENGSILTLLASGMEKSEILQELPYAKSQGYEKIKAAQRMAREVRDRCL